MKAKKKLVKIVIPGSWHLNPEHFITDIGLILVKKKEETHFVMLQ